MDKKEKYIYKITNKINNKIYIGCTNDPKMRKTQHFSASYRKGEPFKALYKAMDELGDENFDFEIIEKTKDYIEREKYWIQFYCSRMPNGYNSTAGGEEPPHKYGDESPFAKHS